MLVIFEDLVGDVATHFGIHGNLREGFLEFFIHGRIVICDIIKDIGGENYINADHSI